MEYAKTTWREGKQLRRFARFADIGAYYAESDPRSPIERAWYIGGGSGWVNVGERADVEDRIRAGKLRGDLDADVIDEARTGCVVIHAGENRPTEAKCFAGLL